MSNTNPSSAGNRSRPHYAFAGTGAIDLAVRPAVSVSLSGDGVTLSDATSGRRHWIPTDRPPRPGMTVYANCSLQMVADDPAFVIAEAGGDLVRTAFAMKTALFGAGLSADVTLLDSSTGSPSLSGLCSRMGIDLRLFHRHKTPLRLLVDGNGDALIVSERPAQGGRTLSGGQMSAAQSALGSAQAVAAVAEIEPALAAAVIVHGRKATRFVCPGAHGRSNRLLELVRSADCLVCGLDQFCRLARAATMDPVLTDEPPHRLAKAVADVLIRLDDLGLAGRRSATCMLGRQGIVVADWKMQTIDHLSLAPSCTDGDATVFRDGGCQFLANLMIFGRMQPAADAETAAAASIATRAVRAVGHAMGLSPVAVATQVLRKGRPGRWRRVRVADGGDSEGGPVAVRQGPTSADVGVDREISAEKHPDGQLRNPLAQHD